MPVSVVVEIETPQTLKPKPRRSLYGGRFQKVGAASTGGDDRQDR